MQGASPDSARELAWKATPDVGHALLQVWPVWAAALLLWLGIRFFKLARVISRHRRLARSGIFEIDGMDGHTFESYLEILFRKQGFNVEKTRCTGDYGADLVMTYRGVRTIVQAKRAGRNVGVKAVQEAAAARGYYGCEEALVVTNSYFTRQARQLAEANNVALWDRDTLIEELLSTPTRL